MKVKSGDDLYRKTNEWRKLNRRIDRDRNEYSERIVDPVTGEMLKEVYEKLSDHRGHAFAKRRKRTLEADETQQ